jgi:long-chain acyl-CoA synthetase
MRPASSPATSRPSSPTTPEWVFADMGVLCAGGVSSGIYPTDSASQVEYLINDLTKVIFAEDDEQLDKILACRALPDA